MKRDFASIPASSPRTLSAQIGESSMDVLLISHLFFEEQEM